MLQGARELCATKARELKAQANNMLAMAKGGNALPTPSSLALPAVKPTPASMARSRLSATQSGRRRSRAATTQAPAAAMVAPAAAQAGAAAGRSAAEGVAQGGTTAVAGVVAGAMTGSSVGQERGEAVLPQRDPELAKGGKQGHAKLEAGAAPAAEKMGNNRGADPMGQADITNPPAAESGVLLGQVVDVSSWQPQPAQRQQPPQQQEEFAVQARSELQQKQQQEQHWERQQNTLPTGMPQRHQEHQMVRENNMQQVVTLQQQGLREVPCGNMAAPRLPVKAPQQLQPHLIQQQPYQQQQEQPYQQQPYQQQQQQQQPYQQQQEQPYQQQQEQPYQQQQEQPYQQQQEQPYQQQQEQPYQQQQQPYQQQQEQPYQQQQQPYQQQQQPQQDGYSRQRAAGNEGASGTGGSLCGKRKAQGVPGDEALPQAEQQLWRLPEAAAVAAPGAHTAAGAAGAQPLPPGQGSSSTGPQQGGAVGLSSHAQGVMVVADQSAMDQLQQLLCKPGSTWAFSLHLDADGLSPGAAGSGGALSGAPAGMVLPRPMPKRAKAAAAAPGLAELEQLLEQEAQGAAGGPTWGWQLMGVAFSVRDGAAFYVPLSSCSRRRAGMLWRGIQMIMQTPGVTKVSEGKQPQGV